MSDKPVIRNQVAGFSNTLNRLRVGHIVDYNGVQCRVSFVNDCRARIIPLSRKPVEIKSADGTEVKFERPQEGYNISPNSEIPIVGYEQP